MIPKIIHYCWFGGKPISDEDQKCVESWKNFCPDYEIRLWNEDNFDLTLCPYVEEAYREKKWAFVSDYARFWIMYNYGGVYFDTDVEIIRSLDDIISNGPFMGTEPSGGINPGLGIGAEKGMLIFKEILDYYSIQHYILPDGSINNQTIVKYTTDIFKQHGWIDNKVLKKVAGIWIYPPEVFCPMNYETGKIVITDKAVSIHHYAASWHSWLEDIILRIERCNSRDGIEFKIRRICSFPLRVADKLQKLGLRNTIKFIHEKISFQRRSNRR